jgi:hypothetical protein
MDNTKYFLVSLRCSKWTARKFDKKTTAEIEVLNHATTEMGRYNKLLLNKSSLSEVDKVFGAARRLHDKLTLPWNDDGDRLLPSQSLMAYRDKMKPLRDDVEAATQRLLASYEQLVADRKLEMNGMFNEADYPSIENLTKKFSCELEVKPLPASNDIRLPNNAEMELELRAKYTDMCAERVQEAQKEIWFRLTDPLKRLIEVLVKDGRIHDSTHSTILEVARMVPQYNVTGDPRLDKAAAEIYALISGVSTDSLRGSDGTRKRTAEAASAMIDSINSQLQGAF